MECASQAEMLSLDTNDSSVKYIEEIREPNNNSSLHDGTMKQCPLCNSEVKLFFINFNEKLLMCENTSCEYPFGHETLQFFKENNEIDTDDEVMSIRTGMSLDNNTTFSVAGNSACWLEIDKLNKATESVGNTQFSNVSPRVKENTSQQAKHRLIDETIQNNINAISKLTTELSTKNPVMIKNKEWIGKLQNMQLSTAREMVKPVELLQCHKDDKILNKDLKIDIRSNENEMASITIEIKDT